METDLLKEWREIRAGMLDDYFVEKVEVLDKLLEQLVAAWSTIASAVLLQENLDRALNIAELKAKIEGAHSALVQAENDALEEFNGAQKIKEFWIFVRAAAARAALKKILEESPKKTFADGIADAVDERNKKLALARTKPPEEGGLVK